MSRRVRRGAAGAVLIALGAAIGLGANAWWFKPLSLNVFYERIFLRYALRDPELLTSLGLLEPFGIEGHNARLTDLSDQRLHELNAFARKELATLRRYDPASQSPSQRLSTSILDWYLDDAVRQQRFMYHDYPVNGYHGVQVALPAFLQSQQPIHDAADARRYARRLRQVGVKMDQVLEGLARRDARGLVPPRTVVTAALEQMRAFVATSPRENGLYTSAADKLARAGVPPQERGALLGEIEAAITGVVYPAYQRLIARVSAIEAKAGPDAGAWHLPEGDAYYAWALRHHTTSNLSPESVHALGLAIAARVSAEMHAVLDTLGVAPGTLADRLRRLESQPDARYPSDESGRAALLADFRTMTAEAQEKASPAFARLPRSRLLVQAVPAMRSGEQVAYYEGPALDGSRPGIVFIDPRHGEARWRMRTTAHHEGFPGHHLQVALATELGDVPTFRTVIPFAAYSEGWGLYAEQLADELGLNPDSYSRLGYLEFRLIRAMRLIVDTGIHYKRWNRDAAIAYMSNWVADSGLVRAEVDRYIVDPGYVCAYTIGAVTIVDLRAQARRELGDRFDVREFHEVVLGNGAMPLDLLAAQVERYIAGGREAGGGGR